ncbi:fap1 adhesin [Amia ocellicauda]|uniref:fap1 adhesin n=1 Tax=Amia ocellicauda TaxID=2972642 RepID=UPI003463AF9C
MSSRKPKKRNAVSQPKNLGGHSNFDSPLGVKLFVPEGVRGTYYITGLSQRRHQERPEFDLLDPHCRLLDNEYNSLQDPHLKGFYKNKARLRSMTKHGLLTKEKKVVCSLKEFNEYTDYLKKIKMDWERSYKQQQKEHVKQFLILQEQKIIPEDVAVTDMKEWLLEHGWSTFWQQGEARRLRCQQGRPRADRPLSSAEQADKMKERQMLQELEVEVRRELRLERRWKKTSVKPGMLKKLREAPRRIARNRKVSPAAEKDMQIANSEHQPTPQAQLSDLVSAVHRVYAVEQQQMKQRVTVEELDTIAESVVENVVPEVNTAVLPAMLDREQESEGECESLTYTDSFSSGGLTPHSSASCSDSLDREQKSEGECESLTYTDSFSNGGLTPHSSASSSGSLDGEQESGGALPEQQGVSVGSQASSNSAESPCTQEGRPVAVLSDCAMDIVCIIQQEGELDMSSRPATALDITSEEGEAEAQTPACHKASSEAILSGAEDTVEGIMKTLSEAADSDQASGAGQETPQLLEAVRVKHQGLISQDSSEEEHRPLSLYERSGSAESMELKASQGPTSAPPSTGSVSPAQRTAQFRSAQAGEVSAGEDTLIGQIVQGFQSERDAVGESEGAAGLTVQQVTVEELDTIAESVVESVVPEVNTAVLPAMLDREQKSEGECESLTYTDSFSSGGLTSHSSASCSDSLDREQKSEGECESLTYTDSFSNGGLTPHSSASSSDCLDREQKSEGECESLTYTDSFSNGGLTPHSSASSSGSLDGEQESGGALPDLQGVSVGSQASSNSAESPCTQEGRPVAVLSDCAMDIVCIIQQEGELDMSSRPATALDITSEEGEAEAQTPACHKASSEAILSGAEDTVEGIMKTLSEAADSDQASGAGQETPQLLEAVRVKHQGLISQDSSEEEHRPLSLYERSGSAESMELTASQGPTSAQPSTGSVSPAQRTAQFRSAQAGEVSAGEDTLIGQIVQGFQSERDAVGESEGAAGLTVQQITVEELDTIAESVVESVVPEVNTAVLSTMLDREQESEGERESLTYTDSFSSGSCNELNRLSSSSSVDSHTSSRSAESSCAQEGRLEAVLSDCSVDIPAKKIDTPWPKQMPEPQADGIQATLSSAAAGRASLPPDNINTEVRHQPQHPSASSALSSASCSSSSSGVSSVASSLVEDMITELLHRLSTERSAVSRMAEDLVQSVLQNLSENWELSIALEQQGTGGRASALTPPESGQL